MISYKSRILSLALTALLFLVLSGQMAYGQGVSYFHSVTASSASCEKGDSVQWLIAISKVKEDSMSWKFYLTGFGGPSDSGGLNSKSVLKQVSTRCDRVGKYRGILLVVDKQETPRSVDVAEVEVLETVGIQKELSGPLLGALIAIVVFLVQGYVRDWTELKLARRHLGMQLKFLVDALVKTTSARSNALPDWFSDPSRDVSIALRSSPSIVAAMGRIRKLCIQVDSRAITEKRFHASLRQLRTLLGDKSKHRHGFRFLLNRLKQNGYRIGKGSRWLVRKIVATLRSLFSQIDSLRRSR
jgi:hypothetical protein